VIPLSIVVIIKNRKLEKNWKEKLETEDSKITFFSCLLRNGGSDKSWSKQRRGMVEP
jgi:hypothetical protein